MKRLITTVVAAVMLELALTIPARASSPRIVSWVCDVPWRRAGHPCLGARCGAPRHQYRQHGGWSGVLRPDFFEGESSRGHEGPPLPPPTAQ